MRQLHAGMEKLKDYGCKCGNYGLHQPEESRCGGKRTFQAINNYTKTIQMKYSIALLLWFCTSGHAQSQTTSGSKYI